MRNMKKTAWLGLAAVALASSAYAQQAGGTAPANGDPAHAGSRAIIDMLSPADATASQRGIIPNRAPEDATTPAGASAAASTPKSATGPVSRVASTPQAITGPCGNIGTQSKGAGTADIDIRFENGSAKLSPHAVCALGELGEALKSPELANYRFRIEGHTDTVGSDDLNQTLSEQRAQSVATYLEQHFAINPSRLEPVGVGKRDPAVPTPDQTAEPRNRRVRLVTLSQQG